MILTGPIRTGKTTALLRTFPATISRGVVQPVVDGSRRVLDLRSGESRALEASPGARETDRVPVGRFTFSASTLDWANACVIGALADAADNSWVVIDEVGPLELGGGGLAQSVRDGIAHTQSPGGPRVLLVVREGIVDAVCGAFGIIDPLVLRLGDRLPDGRQIGGRKSRL